MKVIGLKVTGLLALGLCTVDQGLHAFCRLVVLVGDVCDD